jgi:hypothetical protein
MKATMFLTYPKRCPVPAIKRGDIVIMDNLPVHEGPACGKWWARRCFTFTRTRRVSIQLSRPSANGRPTQGS